MSFRLPLSSIAGAACGGEGGGERRLASRGTAGRGRAAVGLRAHRQARRRRHPLHTRTTEHRSQEAEMGPPPSYVRRRRRRPAASAPLTNVTNSRRASARMNMNSLSRCHHLRWDALLRWIVECQNPASTMADWRRSWVTASTMRTRDCTPLPKPMRRGHRTRKTLAGSVAWPVRQPLRSAVCSLPGRGGGGALFALYFLFPRRLAQRVAAPAARRRCWV